MAQAQQLPVFSKPEVALVGDFETQSGSGAATAGVFEARSGSSTVTACVFEAQSGSGVVTANVFERTGAKWPRSFKPFEPAEAPRGRTIDREY